MSTISVERQRKRQSIHAVVTRADGTVEDLGMIAYWHRNPLMRLAWRVWRAVRRAFGNG